MKLKQILVIFCATLITGQCASMVVHSRALASNDYSNDVLEYAIGRAYNACKNGDIAQLTKILDDYNLNINTQDDNGRTLLHTAAAYCNDQIVDFLLAKGAYVNAQDKNGKTALHSVIESDCYLTISFYKAIQYAVHHPAIEAIKLLLCYGANINLRDKYGNKSLYFLYHPDYRTIIKLIVNHQDLYELTKKNPKEAFKKAIEQGYYCLVKELVSQGVPVDLSDLQLAKDACKETKHQSAHKAIGRFLIEYLRLAGELKAPKHMYLQRLISYFWSIVWPSSKTQNMQGPIAKHGIQATGLTKDLVEHIARMTLQENIEQCL